jgi:Ca2+-binding RTX toxin-like protein
MLVRFPQKLVISEYFNYGRFGEMVLALPLPGEPRAFSGTALDEPGAAANGRTAANALRRITLDDNQSAQNPPILRHPNGAAFSLTNKFRGGDGVESAIGALGFDFNLYRIFPTGPANYTADNTRPLGPEPVGGSLRVAAMNTLNFFLTIDTTDNDTGPGPCGGGANLDCRGADDDVPNDPTVDDEFTRQRAKLLEALVGLDADVLGLNELENTPNVDPLGDPTNGLVAGLNGILGAGTYASIDTGTIGTDAIKVGLIYKPGAVTPIGSFEVLDSTDDPRFIDTRSRPALAQTFEEIATGARFTVVVNHLKSKGSACAGDPDALDGQGNCNGTRTLAAQALVDWVATDPTGSGDPDFLIMGDLNSYAMEDPIGAIKAGADDTPGTSDDWTNLIAQYQGPYAYSYVFDGQNGYLDHALANATIAGQVVGAADWHINADEANVLDYDVTFKPGAQELLYEENQYRTSDHDPVVVGLNLVNEAPTIVVTAGLACSTTANGGSFSLTVDDNERAAGDLTLSVESNTNPTLIPSIVFGGTGADRTVAITAANKQSGTAVLTIGVNDGWNTTTTTITVQVGTYANDSLTGTGGADLLIGLQGTDTLSGLGGPDVLCGGTGVDNLAGGDGNDALEGDRGSDVLSGGEGNDVLRGGAGNDALAGEGGDDTLTGNRGADAFSGGTGADTNTDFTPADGDTSDGT